MRAGPAERAGVRHVPPGRQWRGSTDRVPTLPACPPPQGVLAYLGDDKALTQASRPGAADWQPGGAGWGGARGR